MFTLARLLHWTTLFVMLAVALASGETQRPTKLRIAAANISSGRYQSYDPGHGIRLLQAVQPDIVAIQEMNYGDNSPKAVEAFVDRALGRGVYYFRESNPKYRIPNGILSRYPIEQSGSWPGVTPNMPDRGFAWAKIRLPGGQELWVVSVHLPTKSAPIRQLEAQALLARVKTNIPEGALLVIAGDMNTKGEREFALDVLAEIVGEKHKADDGTGNRATNKPRTKHYDRILLSPSLDAFQVPLELDLKTNQADAAQNKSIFPNGLVFDTRVIKILPTPALFDDSEAENMQHMMVLQDFAVPGLK